MKRKFRFTQENLEELEYIVWLLNHNPIDMIKEPFEKNVKKGKLLFDNYGKECLDDFFIWYGEWIYAIMIGGKLHDAIEQNNRDFIVAFNTDWKMLKRLYNYLYGYNYEIESQFKFWKNNYITPPKRTKNIFGFYNN